MLAWTSLRRVARTGAALATLVAAHAAVVRPLSAQNVVLSGTAALQYDLPQFEGLTPGQSFEFSITLPQSPTIDPALRDETFFLFAPVSATLTQGSATITLTDYALAVRSAEHPWGAGFSFTFGEGALFGAFLGTTTPFTGPTSRPTFTPGTYAVPPLDPNRNLTDTPVTSYTITAQSAVPEPATIVLVATGAALVGGMAAVRRRRSAV